MPSVTCAKEFSLAESDFHYSDGSRPTIREMVLRATNDGDFQSCNILDATVTFKRSRVTATGTVVRTRHMDIRQFPSVSDCVTAFESDEYFAGLDCFAEVD